MSIFFIPDDKRFILETANTEYAFSIAYDRFLMHEYYGNKRNDKNDFFKPRIKAFSVYADSTGYDFSLTDSFLEFPFFGCGDFRNTALRLQGKNGDSCTAFDYKDYRIFKGRRSIKNTPFARPLENTETLEITMYDAVNECTLRLYYTLFPDFDVITRSFALENNSTAEILIKKAMSLSLDIAGHNFDMISLCGKYGLERFVNRSPLSIGTHTIESRRGASGHEFNPFLALAAKNTDEENGEIFAFNLIYSGSFSNTAEVDPGGNTRVVIGLGEENFKYTLAPGEVFESPEALMLYSSNGIGDMSRKMHGFIRNAIVPKNVLNKKPIVINTWESCLFDINEKTVLDFAKEAANCGVDTIVIDDGWYGQRNNDCAGLGDWYVNREKFPRGLKELGTEIKKLGLGFGIWIEPEMVNPESDLYKVHPDWCLRVHGRKPSVTRHQLVLDMCNPSVREYIKKSLLDTLGDISIDYVKWDFNRSLSEVGSYYLDASREEEAWYRYQLGVYEMLRWFRTAFPNVFLESCSGGGGRYDLGMMALSEQVWTSDNTSFEGRTLIQYGSSVAYPACVMSCHVSEPGDTDRLKKLTGKYHVALGGMLGYEFNIIETENAIKAEMLKQTEFFREVESLIKLGDLYRLVTPDQNDCEAYAYCYTASADMEEAAGDRFLITYLQNRAAKQEGTFTLKIPVTDESSVYTDVISGRPYTGKELKAGITVNKSDTAEYSFIIYLKKQ